MFKSQIIYGFCVTCCLAGCSPSVSHLSSRSPAETSNESNAEELKSMLEQIEPDLIEMSRGASLLVSLSSEPDKYGPLLDFLKTIDADELRCSILDLGVEEGPRPTRIDFPRLMYAFHRSYFAPDGTYRQSLDRKSGVVLVDAKTLQCIDYAFGDGYGSESYSRVGQEVQWETEWLQPDGSRTRYRIQLHGFEKIESDG